MFYYLPKSIFVFSSNSALNYKILQEKNNYLISVWKFIEMLFGTKVRGDLIVSTSWSRVKEACFDLFFDPGPPTHPVDLLYLYGTTIFPFQVNNTTLKPSAPCPYTSILRKI